MASTPLMGSEKTQLLGRGKTQLMSSGKTALTGPGSSRRLESDSGRLRRAARSLRRQGYMDEAGKVAMAAETSRPVGIQSADDRMAAQEYNLRSIRGMAEQQRRGYESAGVQTPMSSQTEQPATGGTGQTVRYVNGLPEVVPASGTQTATGGTNAPASGTKPAGSGTKPAGSGVMTTTGGTPYNFTDSPNRLNLDTSERGPFKGGLTEQQDRTPGNRASAERESVLAQIRRESANSSDTRSSILARINRERLDAGKPRIDISAEEFAKADSAEADKRYAEAGRKARDAFDTAEAAKPKSIGYSKAQQYKDEVAAAAPSGKPLEDPLWAKTRAASPEDSVASRLLGGSAERPAVSEQGNPLNYSRGGALTAAGTGMSIAGAGATSFTAPSVFSETLRKERAKGYKAPLYSAAVAAKRGAGALLSDIKRGYK